MNIRLIGVFILIALVAFFSYFMFFAQPCPPNHQTIVDSIRVRDVDAGLQLTPRLVDSGSSEWGKGLMLVPAFEQGKTYQQTTWLWQRYGDTEFVMTIWGPDESGSLYFIEFGRVGADAFRIVVNSETVEIPSILSDPGARCEGYYSFSLELP